MEREEIIEGILYLLQGTSPTFDGRGYTLLQIREFLKLNNVKDYSESIGKLRKLLNDMENNGLIEKRHFGEKYHGRVDYGIEQKGIDIIDKKRKELKEKGIKLDNKWKGKILVILHNNQ